MRGFSSLFLCRILACAGMFYPLMTGNSIAGSFPLDGVSGREHLNPVCTFGSEGASERTLSSLIRDIQDLRQSLGQNLESNDRLKLICGSGAQGLPRESEIEHFIEAYEREHGSEARKEAIAVLTRQELHSDGRVEKQVGPKQRQAMEKCEYGSLCQLIAYWHGDRALALRALALFYETGMVIQGGQGIEKGSDEMFNRDSFYLVERTIRSIPRYWQKVLNDFAKASRKPGFTLVPITLTGDGRFGSVIAKTLGGGLSLEHQKMNYLAKGRTRMGRSLNVDARQYLILHEMAHEFASSILSGSIDTQNQFIHPDHPDPASQVKVPQYGMEDTFKGKRWQDILNAESPFVFPWSAEPYMGKIESGGKKPRNYDSETYAEAVTGYFLTPDHLRKSRPQMYHFIKEQVFKGQEFIGLESCPGGIFSGREN